MKIIILELKVVKFYTQSRFIVMISLQLEVFLTTKLYEKLFLFNSFEIFYLIVLQKIKYYKYSFHFRHKNNYKWN